MGLFLSRAIWLVHTWHSTSGFSWPWGDGSGVRRCEDGEHAAKGLIEALHTGSDIKLGTAAHGTRCADGGRILLS